MRASHPSAPRRGAPAAALVADWARASSPAPPRPWSPWSHSRPPEPSLASCSGGSESRPPRLRLRPGAPRLPRSAAPAATAPADAALTRRRPGAAARAGPSESEVRASTRSVSAETLASRRRRTARSVGFSATPGGDRCSTDTRGTGAIRQRPESAALRPPARPPLGDVPGDFPGERCGAARVPLEPLVLPDGERDGARPPAGAGARRGAARRRACFLFGFGVESEM